MSTPKILIFGNGQIGNFYQKYFQDHQVASRIAPTDITNPAKIEAAISGFNPTIIINTAAKTNLEWCGQNQLEAFNVNVLGTQNLAAAADKHGIFFVHLSSGCIFQSADADDAKVETDTPAPAAFYSWTKVWSEQVIAFNCSPGFRYLILRPRQPVSAQISPKNMLIKMLTFTKFVDTPNTGTVLEDLMGWTDSLIRKQVTGVVHVANTGWVTPYDIALLLKKHILPTLPIEKITKEELDRLTPNRRVDTVLNVDKLKSFGIEVRPYKERIEEIIKNLASNIASADKTYLSKVLEETATASRQRTIINNSYLDLLI